MDSKFFASHVIKTKNSDGTTTTSEIFSMEAIANQNLLTIFIGLAIIGLFAPFFSILLAVIYVVLSDEGPKLLSLIGVAGCVYLLYDIKHEWLGSLFLGLWSTQGEMDFYIKLTMSMLLVHVVHLLFGNILYELAFREKVVFFFYTFAIWGLSYFGAIFILTHFIKITFAK
jgi:hypothetical protein